MTVIGVNGIEKCRLLREIRRKICLDNGLPFTEEDCPNESFDCRGTCPVCEMNLLRLSEKVDELERSGVNIRFEGAMELYETRRNS